MIVHWTRRAESDLFEQCSHIAESDPVLTARLGREILSMVDGLRDFPPRGRPGRVEGTRELVLPGLPWIGVYAVAEGRVVILRLLHGAQAHPERRS